MRVYGERLEADAVVVAVPHAEALRIQDDVAFFQAVQAVLACGGRPLACASAITAQPVGGEFFGAAVSADALAHQLDASLADGPISGSATVVNGIVYFATLKKRTYALDARTGRQLWTFPDGQYTPVVADRDRLYLIGHGLVYGMVPR